MKSSAALQPTNKVNEMKSLQDLQIEIQPWAEANFGPNQSKVDPDCFLGSLAPLMGMGEEIGEYYEAPNQEETLDAIGDIGIYLCDYCNRSGHALQEPKPQDCHDDPPVVFIQAIGRLFHCNLKRQQGIRGFDSMDFFQNKQREAVAMLVNALDRHCREEFTTTINEVIQDVWTEIVVKRDWLNDPRNPNA